MTTDWVRFAELKVALFRKNCRCTKKSFAVRYFNRLMLYTGPLRLAMLNYAGDAGGGYTTPSTVAAAALLMYTLVPRYIHHDIATYSVKTDV